MKNKNKKDMIAYFFVFLQSVLTLSFLVIDLTDGNSNLSSRIKFLIIILCFCYVLFLGKSAGKSISLFHRLFLGAVFFTVISDLFLLILDYYFVGMLTFIIVQQLYGRCLDITGDALHNHLQVENSDDYGKENRNLYKGSKLKFYIRIGIQIVISLGVILTFQQLGIRIDGILMATVFYFISIVTNVIRAFLEAHNAKVQHDINQKYSILYAVGMVLFLLCDINVGLFNMTDFISISKQNYQLLYNMSSILMWTFYAPAQILIALSGKRRCRGLSY